VFKIITLAPVSHRRRQGESFTDYTQSNREQLLPAQPRAPESPNDNTYLKGLTLPRDLRQRGTLDGRKKKKKRFTDFLDERGPVVSDHVRRVLVGAKVAVAVRAVLLKSRAEFKSLFTP
jgi:hypothetical protein